MVYDDTGAVVEVSHSWTSLSGYSLTELPTIADWIREAFGGRDDVGVQTGEIWKDEYVTYHAEADLRTKAGESRTLAVSSVWLEAPRGGRRLRVVAADDVTEQRRSELERIEAGRQKDEFIAMLGHELRNPLAAVRSATELLQRARPDDALIQRTQAILERQTTHMARLLDGLLDLSRIVRGRIALDKRLVDLGALVRDAVRDYSVTLRDAGLELRVDVPPDPLWTNADPVRLSQVATNLLSNAIKFTPSPGTVAVRLTEQDGLAVLSVADTGNGIDPELLPKLFQPFRQAHQSIDRSLGGLGLGLSLVKTLVELHDGTVEASSEGEGLGSEFIVRLPLTRRRPTDAETATGGKEPLRILIIEDNDDAAESLREILEFEGHETAVAGGGSRGIELARKFDPDVVLCDLGLPDLNGFDVAVALREDPRTRDLYLVALSGYGRPEDKRRCEDVGFDSHLTKPVLMRDLEEVLARAGKPRPRWGPSERGRRSRARRL
jgi:PAS domain S-box-containing protein